MGNGNGKKEGFWKEKAVDVKRRIEAESYDFHLRQLPKILPKYFDVTISGRENLPSEEGVILAPNHTTCLDHYILGTELRPRRIHYFVQAESIRQKLALNFYHWAMGNIWVMVDGDKPWISKEYRDKCARVAVKAMKRAEDYLRTTIDDIGIFVDGPTKDSIDWGSGEIRPVEERAFHAGAAVLAMKSAKLVVPISLRIPAHESWLFWEVGGIVPKKVNGKTEDWDVGKRGYFGLFSDLEEHKRNYGRIPYQINIGEPLSFGKKFGVENASREIKRRVCALYNRQ